jgi:hypothetical protein
VDRAVSDQRKVDQRKWALSDRRPFASCSALLL